MNHEIEDDADISAASGVRRKSMGLDETRLSGDGLHVAEGGVESFDVADLENQAILLSKVDQFGGLKGSLGHRFFDEDMFAGGKERFADLEMSVGWGDYAESIRGLGGGLNGWESDGAALVGDFLRDRVVGIENAREKKCASLGAGEFSVNARVLFPERPGSDHCHSEWFRHTSMITDGFSICNAEMKSAQWLDR